MEACRLEDQVEAMSNNPLQEMLGCHAIQPQQQERKPRPQTEQSLNCPRCNSANTKFCYYNNYSLSQPRYFCKACRRYWTKGGTLRNVPVGGGCRKNKRSSSNKKMHHDHNLPTRFDALLPSFTPALQSPPPFVLDSNDLTLAFSNLHKSPALEGHDGLLLPVNTNADATSPQVPSFLDILGIGFPGDRPLDDPRYGLGGHNGNAEGVGGGGPAGERAAAAALFEGPGSLTPFPKQESSCKSTSDEDSRLFMGLQWHPGTDGATVIDPGRDFWNSVGSSWHGLLNGSLI